MTKNTHESSKMTKIAPKPQNDQTPLPPPPQWNL